MFANYLKLTIRNLIRNKLYAIISIFGLAVGILCAVLILLFIADELSYDRHHEKHESIYRIESSLKYSDNAITIAMTPYFLGKALREEYPEIEEMVRLRQAGGRFRYKDKEFDEGAVYLADETFFDIFTYTFVRGTPEGALDLPGDLVITETFAERYFKSENPIGKTIQAASAAGGFNFQVTAVIADLPDGYNTTLQFDALGSMATFELLTGQQDAIAEMVSLTEPNTLTYVLTEKNAAMQSVIGNFEPFHEKYFSTAMSYSNGSFGLMATALKDVHFRTGLEYDFQAGGNILYVYILATVAIFLLLIAAINYMNMAMAHSARRAKEIGLRKVVGALKGQIIGQFLTESTVISLSAAIISVLSAEALLPLFNQLSGKQLTLLTSGNITLFVGILAISIAVGLVAGSYPAFSLSRFMPARILKETEKSGYKGGILRKALVIIQFTISIVMIIATILLFQQLDYLRNRDLGFDKENLIAVPVWEPVLQSSLHSFREELLRSPVILDAAVASGAPGIGGMGKAVCQVETGGEMRQETFDLLYADYDYLDLMGISLSAGRNFSRDMATDEYQGFIVNEALARRMGWRSQAVGKRIMAGLPTREGSFANRNAKVIGVVRDFSFGSLQSAVSPTVIVLNTEPHRVRWGQSLMTLRIAPGRTSDVTDFIDRKRKEFSPYSSPVQTIFVEQALRQYYLAEERMSTIFGYASIVCILVSFLGLLGLSSFMTEQRTKEIGIRKVLGASIPNLVSLLSEHFIWLATIANVIAWPTAFYGVTRWLENYYYRIDIGVLAFIASGTLSVMVTLLAVGFQAYRVASGDPVQSLRSE